jgi:hypothetical protein
MSTKPISFIVDKKKYFNAKDIKIYDSAFFYGTSRTIRSIIIKKNISSTKYIYASFSKKNGWKLSLDQIKPPSRANLLLSEKWVLNNVPKMKIITSNDSKYNIYKPLSPTTSPSSKTGSLKNTRITVPSLPDYEYPITPDILLLSNNEKFKGNDGKPVEIETRGERTPNGIYFLVKDVSRIFEMNKLDKTIIDERKSYILHDDYEIFLSDKVDNGDLMTSKNKTYVKSLYLTYEGMIKILYTSRSGNAKNFRIWATNILFTIQIGSKEEKEDLISGVLGINAKLLKEVLSSTVSVPCIYLFSLGKAKCLRKSMNLDETIPDDHIIVKYGLTENLIRRTGEHIRTYEKTIKNSKLKILQYVYVDTKYLQNAENDIKDFFKDIETPINSHKSFNELVAINPNHIKQIQRQYKLLHNEFAGCVRGLLEKVKFMENDYKWKLKEKDLIIQNKDLIIENKDLIIENKDLIIENKDLIIKNKENDIKILQLQTNV